ncbi:zinc finger SWIM domain-containing protein 8-like protein [Leptotrombidium deliense]|uniref:Zinc finger SWIM domain-containing protein 8-like protein n=1 Tax=Leptotrombidium deliense TaxID=299467 RepID=A0A443SKX6_9ACAR|nr:zinc finger SWIM domain-containing protein 8-like protein [Leptotrombidium deliense]
MFEWEEGDRYSFEDSDRFEEDSLCSWMSEPESVCSNWRGWKKAYNYANQSFHNQTKSCKDGQVLPLVELAAKEVACYIPFEAVEHFYIPVPEQLQLRIAFWSFPDNEEDIRLYSCLANGSADEFQRGESLLKAKAVKDMLQIGFHLSATVTITTPHIGSSKGMFKVAVTFDRRRITSCNCTCMSRASWCSHVVAVCLFRIHQPTQVCLRAPVSESLSRLHRDQLQKFAQYLISELPQQILPTAQRLLDDLLSNQHTKINTLSGAPDPTAGASVNEQTTWCLDESQIHENIRKILIKLCVPSPIVFSDVNYLSYTAHPAAAEWASLLRPLRGREPEGMWNLLSIVREMFRRGDRNAIPLLEILTAEVLACDQIILWWFNTKVTFHAGGNGHGNRNSLQGNTHASQHACSSLCDEIVVLWRLACLNPALNSQERKSFYEELHDWHIKTLERVWKMRSTGSNSNGNSNSNNNMNNNVNKRSDFEVFPGFKPSMEACFLDWDDYPIPGVTYVEGYSRRWYFPCTHASTHKDPVSTGFTICSNTSINVTNSSACNRRISKPGESTHTCEKRVTQTNEKAPESAEALSSNISVINSSDIKNDTSSADVLAESNRSSFSSEGFCETSEIEQLDSDTVANNGEATASLKRKNGKSLKLNLRESTLDDIQSKNSEVHLNYSENAHSSHQAVDNSSVESCDNDAIASENVDCKENTSHESANTSSETQKVDEYQMYRYDPSTVTSSLSNAIESQKSQRKGSVGGSMDEQFVVVVKKMEDPFEILFARAEALHAHGLSREASRLAVQLAEDILANPPNLMIDLPNPPVRGKRNRRFNPTCHNISLLASATLSKAAFLCSVLSETVENHHLAFRVGLFGLEIARPPASTKALEVKLANQEQELVVLLKKIPLASQQLQVLREKAEQLKDGKLKSRGEALLPLMLASYIFDAFVLSPNQQTRNGQLTNERLPSDELLGFEAAVAALGLKANVSEAEHPLLCEGTRRQRGDLAITLLVHYKDDKEKLAKIMDKLLDKEVHQMYKNPTSATYSAVPDTITPDSTSSSKSVSEVVLTTPVNTSVNNSSSNSDESDNRDQGIEIASQSGDGSVEAVMHTRQDSRRRGQLAERRPSDGDRSEGASSPGWDEDYKAWEARFRCTNLKTAKKHSVGMASIDSSAPETTSSDNSPTVVRRYIRPGGPGSDSGSSGESSDSFASSSSGDKIIKNSLNNSSSVSFSNDAGTSQMTVTSRLNNCSITDCSSIVTNNRPANSAVITMTNCSPGNTIVTNATSTPTMTMSATTISVPAAGVVNCTKSARFKGKRANPSIPNQPSQASSHFMFELAKTVLTKAGGNSSSGVLFTQPTSSQNHRLPHRALHMCAFQIGLYALGLHNAVTPNWLSRTYSSHVSWITGQAAEIGAPAINFLIDTWEGHLTPPEVASLADRASRGRDKSTVRAAAKLALSCLPHASALNPNEIQRALIQCRELSNETLEQACLAIEAAAKGGGVYPEVLFEVARYWHELYEESLPKNGNRTSAQSSVRNNSDNRTPYVQASIGEFQVPTSDSAGASGNNFNVLPEASQHLMVPNGERQLPTEVIVSQTSHVQPSVVPFQAMSQSPAPLPIQALLQPPPYSIPSHPSATLPYRFFSGIAPFPPTPPLPLHTAYIQGPPPFQYPYYSPTTSVAAVAAAAMPHLRGAIPPNALFPGQPLLPNVVLQNTAMNQGQRLLIPTTGPQTYMIPMCGPPIAELHLQPQFHINPMTHQPQQPLQQLNQRQLGFLLAAYRVGMLAMEILGRRVHDDRPQTKYARNPPYGEDVKWLLGISKKLGTSYLQELCICTVNSVASPFVLLEIVLDAIAYLSQQNNPPIPQPLRSPMITPLIHKCQQMFSACTHFKMYHITPSDYEEFVQVIRGARQAYQLTPGGMVQFNELLQNLKRSKSYKKELWQHLQNALQQNSGTL